MPLFLYNSSLSWYHFSAPLLVKLVSLKTKSVTFLSYSIQFDAISENNRNHSFFQPKKNHIIIIIIIYIIISSQFLCSLQLLTKINITEHLNMP